MNPDTGHLIRVENDEEMQHLVGYGYERVPEELEGAAKRKLAGRKEAYVSLTSGGKLSRWAAKRRKAKRKMAKESRRRNRRRNWK